MKLPAGRLVRSRVVDDPRTVLVDALDRDLTGYAVLEPQGSLLLDDDGTGVVTFAGGVPVVAYHTGTDRGGPPALADLAAAGPYRLELYGIPGEALGDVHDRSEFRVPPGMPAERLAGDRALADSTRECTPERLSADSFDASDDSFDGGTGGSTGPGSSTGGASGDQTGRRPGAVEAFLDDEAKIAAIREQARAEAEERAAEWGFDDVE